MKCNRFFKLPISNKKMASTMYALLMTRSKLVNSYSNSIHKYSRKQSSGFLVDVVIEIDTDQIDFFENLSGIKLKTSEEFQGTQKVN